MKYNVGQKILYDGKEREIVANGIHQERPFYIVKKSIGWKKSSNVGLNITSGDLNDIDNYWAIYDSEIDDYVNAYNKKYKHKNLPREYSVKTANLEQAREVGNFFRLNYPEHVHYCTYDARSSAHYAVYKYKGKKKICDFINNLSDIKGLLIFEFIEWKTIINNQKFKVGDFLASYNGGTKVEIKAICIDPETNGNMYLAPGVDGNGYGGKAIYEEEYGEPFLGVLNDSEDYLFFTDDDAVEYVETNKYELSKYEFDKAFSDIGNALKIQPVYFDNIPKTFKIKYQSTDGENKAPEITANSLEEALSTIKDLKEFHYHMEY